MKKRTLAALLALGVTALLPLAGCGSQSQVQAADLMEGVDPKAVEYHAELTGPEAAAVTDFGLRLFQAAREEGENTLVSPLSVLSALAMTANGAQGETLEQMEAVLGLPVQDLNQSLAAYTQALPQGEDYKLSLANSLWIKDDGSIRVEEDFLQSVVTWYDAGVYQAPFDDATVQDINAWVRENTDGMIQDIIHQIPGSAVLYLVNALAFDAQWQEVYREHQVREGVFTTEDGTAREAEFLHSGEYWYLEDENATGFLKNYKDGSYAFAALLPREGVSLGDYVDSLTGQALHDLLTGAEDATVYASIPKFQTEYSANLSEVLQTMGMTEAFDMAGADFSAMGTTDTGMLYISQVLHKTYLALSEQGTRAGAATAVLMDAGGAAPMDIKEVYLDRPFLYMIVDREARLPVFLGVVTDLEA